MLRLNLSNLHTNTFILLLFCTTTFYAQISGIVLDSETNLPLEKVNIYLKNNKSIGTVSDKNGNFKLKLKSNSKSIDSISFSMVGYKTYTISVLSLKENINNIYLKKSLASLDEVYLKGSKLKPALNYDKIASLTTKVYSFASCVIKNELYISGGDLSIQHESFKEALEKASEGVFFPTIESISNEMYSKNFISNSDKLIVFNLDNLTSEIAEVKISNRAYHQMPVYKNKLYILGGKKVSNFSTKEFLLNEIEIFDLNNRTIEIDKTNPHKAVNFTTFIYKDHLFSLGGSTKIKKSGSKVFTDKISVLNLKNGYWYDFGNLSTPKETNGIRIDDKVYLIGGLSTKPLTTIESWDLTTNTWTTEGELLSELERPSLTSNKKTIYIYNYGKLILYNTLNKTLKEYNINLHLKNPNIHFYNDALYIIGGYFVKEYSKEPTSGIYKIELEEFNKTKMSNYKSL